MLGPVRLRSGVVVDDTELRWRFSRSSGPGGQSVNTTDSRAELTWDANRSAALSPEQRERVLANLAPRLADGVLTVVASEHRSQLRNREAAVARFAALLDEALRPPAPPRRPTKPSKTSRERRRASERHRRTVKAMRQRPSRSSRD